MNIHKTIKQKSIKSNKLYKYIDQLNGIIFKCVDVLKLINSNTNLLILIHDLKQHKQYEDVLKDVENLIRITKNKNEYEYECYITKYYDNENYINKYYIINNKVNKHYIDDYYDNIIKFKLILTSFISFYNNINREILIYEDYLNILNMFKKYKIIEFINYYNELIKYKDFNLTVNLFNKYNYDLEIFINNTQSIINKFNLQLNNLPDDIKTYYNLTLNVLELKQIINDFKTINLNIYNQLITKVNIIKYIINIDLKTEIINLNIETLKIKFLISDLQYLIQNINRLSLCKDINITIDNVIDIIFENGTNINSNHDLLSPHEKIKHLNELIISTFN